MLTTYDLFNDMLSLRNVVDRFIAESPGTRRGTDFPYINIYEKDDTVEARIIAPGVKAENVDLQLRDNALTVTVKKEEDYREQPYIRQERRFGEFSKTLKLPYRVDPEKVEANMHNGILTVKMVKHEAAKPRKIEIK
mgnify:FL=1